MRFIGLLTLLLFATVGRSQWSCKTLPVQHQGQALMINGGIPSLVSSYKLESQKETWKTDVVWKSIFYKNNQFSDDFIQWPGVGVGYQADTLKCYTQYQLIQGKQWSKIVFQLHDSNQVLMGESLSNDSDPYFDAKEGWLYFSSDRSGGLGGSDIYRVKWLNGSWSEVQNLGLGVNSNLDERYPNVNPDGLCFSARTERGDWDIFLSPFHESFDVRWQMESPINSTADDYQWVQWSDESGWLISNRNQQSVFSNGLFELQKTLEQDTFCFVFPEPFMWKRNEVQVFSFGSHRGCVSLSLGATNRWQFLDSTGHPLYYESFLIEDKNGETIAQLLTDNEGRVSWEYLGISMGNAQWLNIGDESNLLADNNGLTYTPSQSQRPFAPTILFQRNISILEERFQNQLIELSMYLLLHPEERVRLIGSCDALGDPVSNERLAWERAFAVQAFLMAHGTLISQIDVEIALPKYSEKNERDRKVDIAFQ